MKDIQVSITEQKRLLNQLLQCAKYSKNPHDLLKYVPSLKISIQNIEINSKKKMNSVTQLEVFPDDAGSIDNYGISHWINRNVDFELSDAV